MPQCKFHPGKEMRLFRDTYTCSTKVGIADLQPGQLPQAPAGTNRNGYCNYKVKAEGQPSAAIGAAIGVAPAHGEDPKTALAVASLHFAARIYEGNPSGANEALSFALSTFDTMSLKLAGRAVREESAPKDDDDIPF